MNFQVNYIAVLVSAVAIFMLGGLWYSLLFAKPWMALVGKTEEELKSSAGGPLSYLAVFVCGLLTSWALAVILNQLPSVDLTRGVCVGALCWLGFAGATSYGTGLFSGKPRGLWLIDSAYNLVSFVIAGAILGAWR